MLDRGVPISHRSRLCRCGHQRDEHEHYRQGSDCAVCGVQLCAQYRRATSRPVTGWLRRASRLIQPWRRPS